MNNYWFCSHHGSPWPYHLVTARPNCMYKLVSIYFMYHNYRIYLYGFYVTQPTFDLWNPYWERSPSVLTRSSDRPETGIISHFSANNSPDWAQEIWRSGNCCSEGNVATEGPVSTESEVTLEPGCSIERSSGRILNYTHLNDLCPFTLSQLVVLYRLRLW